MPFELSLPSVFSTSLNDLTHLPNQKLRSHLKFTPPIPSLTLANQSSSPIYSVSSIFLNALSSLFLFLLPFAAIISHLSCCNSLLSVSPLESNPSPRLSRWEGGVCMRNLISLPCSKAFNGSLLCHDSKHTHNALCLTHTISWTSDALTLILTSVQVTEEGIGHRGKMTHPRLCSCFSLELGLNPGAWPEGCAHSRHKDGG